MTGSWGSGLGSGVTAQPQEAWPGRAGGAHDWATTGRSQQGASRLSRGGCHNRPAQRARRRRAHMCAGGAHDQGEFGNLPAQEGQGQGQEGTAKPGARRRRAHMCVGGAHDQGEFGNLPAQERQGQGQEGTAKPGARRRRAHDQRMTRRVPDRLANMVWGPAKPSARRRRAHDQRMTGRVPDRLASMVRVLGRAQAQRTTRQLPQLPGHSATSRTCAQEARTPSSCLHPDGGQEFRSRRDRISEKLYTSLLPRCFGCDRVESRVTTEGEDGEGDGSVKREVEKESKVDSRSNEVSEELNRVVGNYSCDEAEALTDEIEEESQVVGEVLRIKEILANEHDELDSVLFDSLRRLQLMNLSVDTLKVTAIGRAVSSLRKHSSKKIRQLVRTLIEGWKVLVDEWVTATAGIADNSPASVNASVMDGKEEVLPSPPLDEGALLAMPTASIQLSECFNGMDDGRNFRNNRELDKSREKGRWLPVNYEPVRKHQPPNQPNIPQDRGQMTKQEPVMSQTEQQAIELSKNPVNHERSKHIDVRFHFIRDQVKEGSVELVHVASRDQVADIYTKPLPTILLDNCKRLIGMKDGRSI